MAHINHELIKKDSIEARLYQEVLVTRVIENGNSLVVAPTALGKTIVAVMLAAHKLKENPKGKVLFLAPTKPLAVQHEKSFKKFLEIDEDKIVSVTGTILPKKRKEIYKNAQIITSTPQTIENDILTGKISLKDFELVIFDECLKGDTKILLNTGIEKPIKEIVKDYFEGKEVYVKSFDTKKQCFVSKKVLAAQKIPCIKPMVRVHTKNKSISCTEDHKLFVKRGKQHLWIETKELQLTDHLSTSATTNSDAKPIILVPENDILEFYSEEQRSNIETYYQVMGLRKKFEEGQVRISKKLNCSQRQVENWIYKNIKPKPIKAIDSMKELGLIPFSTSFPNIEIIAKLIGHIFGDGWISQTKTSHYSVWFSGRIKDLKRIQEDLKTLGIKYSKIYSRQTESQINGNKVSGQSNSFNCSDSRLTRLLVLLGSPIGSKTTQKIAIPKWILTGSIEIQRAFLSSYFGSEGTQIKEKKDSMSFYPTRISLNQVAQIKNNGKQFLKDISKMLKKAGVNTLEVTEGPGNLRKDGSKTVKLVLTLSNSSKNQLNFLQNISYSYAIDKEIKARKAIEYLLIKSANIKNKNNLQRQAVKLKQQGFSNSKIAKILSLKKYQVEKWFYTKGNNCVSQSLIKFDKYSNYSIANVSNEKITKVERTKPEEFVYDLTVEETHNFIANGIITHNCHRAVGDYAYVFINLQLQKQNKKALVLALTASPGSEEEKIQDVCRNLSIKNIEIKNSEDEDVKPYVNEIEIDWVKVDLPKKFLEIKYALEEFQKQQIIFLKEMHVAVTANKKYYNRIRILEMQRKIRVMLNNGRNPSMYVAMSRCAALLKIAHAEELIETQGISALKSYFDKLRDEAAKGKSKAAKQIVASRSVQLAMNTTYTLFEKNIQHPKYEELKKVILKQITENPKSKVLVFNQYRDSIREVVKFLETEKKLNVSKFIGQAKKGKEKGMSQKEQQQIIDELKEGKFNVLVMSSVGEEGLDIPAVDMVVFFEPVPSEIRTIQRRGRTGRFGKGKNVILMTKGTRDEAYYWAAKNKEKKMKTTLGKMKGKEANILPEQQTLAEFSEEKSDTIIIFVDNREQASSVTKDLFGKDCKIIMKQLAIGDYVLSKDVCVERKTIEDFLSSMIDGRLFNQMIDLRQNYPKPLVLLEGNVNELFTSRNIHKNAIMGALTSIALDYNVPIINTKDTKETAEYLYVIAKREQIGRDKEIRLRMGRKGLTTKEQQQFIIEGLPLVGPTLAKNLLEKFKSIKSIANADEKRLQKVENLGPKKAKHIRKILEAKYEEGDGKK
jgi:ERCC4-related helicase/intein/homing endonuclease